MRTRALLGSIFASAGILIIGWEAGAALLASPGTASAPVTDGSTGGTTTGGTTTGGTTSGSSTSGTTSTPAPTATATTPTATTPTGPADGTYTGELVDTRFGTVQVSVTISGGTITDVAALKLTDDDGRSVQISNRAAPILREEVLASQSASVANVSGATYTTHAYLTSVQSALDQAGF